MKYESNILDCLVKTYGVIGNPKYVSEIIKQFIIQGKECYPNLFTYQADWLAHIDEFGLTPEYTVSYTGQQFYAPNTMEKPVKRAILSGQTLVNLLEPINYPKSTTENTDLKLTQQTKTNTEYTVIINVSLNNATPNVSGLGFLKSGVGWVSNNSAYTSGINKIKLTTNSNVATHLRFKGGNGITIESIVLLEGDYTNVDIPYFEGMQSVRMPVLTTSNEDGTKTNILTVNEDVTLRSNGSVCDEVDLLTGKLTQRIDEDGEILTQEVVKTVDLTILDQNGQNAKQLMSFNGGTHFTTSSQDGSLLPTLTVDVVTDLEEILMVCSSEGITM